MKTLQQQFGTDSLHNTQLLLVKGGAPTAITAQQSGSATDNDDPYIED